MILVRHWIHSFPDAQKEAIADALESASLAKIRRALRLLEEMDQDQRGPILDVELLSTFNLEPILPVIQFALNCIPSRARLRLAPLDAIEAQFRRSQRSRSMPELFFGESKKRYLIYCILIRPAFRKKLPAASISSAKDCKE